MTRDWEPGDVAMVTCSDGVERRAMCEPHVSATGAIWRFPDGRSRYVDDPSARPLVVIDLPRGALAGWPVLIDALKRAKEETGLTMVFGGLIEQIEEQTAEPEPPKPDEPLGLGAVVVDQDDRRWVRVSLVDGATWRCDLLMRWCEFANITAVTVLSEGVQ